MIVLLFSATCLFLNILYFVDGRPEEDSLYLQQGMGARKIIIIFLYLFLAEKSAKALPPPPSFCF